MQTVILRKAFPYLILLVAAMAGFFQVAFLQHPLKWDLLDQAYPWKYFIGECLQHGILPLWNPYQQLGYPIHADPQSSAWYPIVWFFGILFGYDMYMLSWDFIIHIFLAGVGMRYLARVLGISGNAGLGMAVAYMLSGFFTGNAQHFMWIIAGTWMPFVLGVFIDLVFRMKPSAILTFPLLMLMMVTGGYPAFIIVLGYILLGLFLFRTGVLLFKRDHRMLRRMIRALLTTAVLTLLVTSVMWVSLWHALPEMVRTEGVSLRSALFGPFSPQCLISLILPYASVGRDMSFFRTDLSLSNAYFGLIPLVFFITSLFLRKDGLMRFFLIAGLVALAASMGKYLGVRELFYHYVPFFNLFRHPSLFRLFFILFSLLLAGLAWDRFIEQPIKHRIIVLRVFAAVLLITGIVSGWLIYGQYLHLGGILKDGLLSASPAMTLPRRVFLQGLWQLTLLVILILLMRRAATMKRLPLWMMLVLCADLIPAAQLNGPYSVYYGEFIQRELKAISRSFTPGFPAPDPVSISHNHDLHKPQYAPLWKNLNIFLKQIAYDGSNPFIIRDYLRVAGTFPQIYRSMIENPPVFIADTVIRCGEMFTMDRRLTAGKACLEERIEVNDFARQRTSPEDTVWIERFTPVAIHVTVDVKDTALLVVMQNRFRGWEVIREGHATAPLKVNGTLMGTLLPPGRQEVAFRFSPRPVKRALAVTAGSLLLLVAGWGIMARKKRVRDRASSYEDRDTQRIR
ncbi:MAG: hypothetical protein JW861_08975 [Bacteroidales bacterium]|nr:hypothetical protein [Bacteroidales bacterium]